MSIENRAAYNEKNKSCKTFRTDIPPWIQVVFLARFKSCIFPFAVPESPAESFSV